MHPDIALLTKDSQPGPRYTSYPPAPHFAEDFGIGQWRQEIIESQEPSRPLSLYVHIPFCDTLCYYCGCNMVATQKYGKATEYLKVLKREIDETAALTDPARRVVQLHWGGGTPTFLPYRTPGALRCCFGLYGRDVIHGKNLQCGHRGCDGDRSEGR